MPELPEVETLVRDLNQADIVGSTILSATVLWPRSIAIPEQQLFCSKIIHQNIKKIHRRGKFLVFTLTHDTLLVHLRMTGKFTLNDSPVYLPHERIQLKLSHGQFLHYEDQRKFGKWYLLSDPSPLLNPLGLEPLGPDYTLEALKELLQKHHSSTLKPFLLNQKYIAGLGNIYVDEALWKSQLHPLRVLSTLLESEIKELFKAIPAVLRMGITHMGTSLGSKRANYFSISGRRGSNQYKLNVFRREGLLCPRCSQMITKIVVAQRGTHFCPQCQKSFS